jgi:hypothetical protein
VVVAHITSVTQGMVALAVAQDLLEVLALETLHLPLQVKAIMAEHLHQVEIFKRAAVAVGQVQ